MSSPPIRVLYVDDEETLLDLAKLFLERTQDFIVDTSISAITALQSLEVSEFDAIISDFQMPGMDGIEFLIQVRSKYPDIPFILFTGRGREEVVVKAIDNGVDFYLQKGGDPKSQFAELAHKVKKSVERNSAVKALAKSEERMRMALDGAKEAHWDINIATGTSYLSPRGCEMLGYTPEEIQQYNGLQWRNLTHPEDIVKTDAVLQDYYQGKSETFQVEQRLRMKNGDWKWMLVRGKVVEYDEHRRPVRFVGTHTDITENKRLEQDLVENRDYLTQIFSTVREGIVIIDAYSHEILDLNPAAIQMIGAKKEEIVFHKCHKYICPAEEGRCPMTDLKQTVDNSERVLTTADGRAIPIIKYVVPFRFKGRDCLLETFVDNSERKKAHDDLLAAYQQISDSEEELRSQFNELVALKNSLQISETKFRTIIETTPDAVWDVSNDGIFTYISPRCYDILGYEPDELVGMSVIDLVIPESKDVFRGILQKGAPSDIGFISLEFPFLHKDGREIILNIRSSPIIDENGSHIGFRGVTRDVTEQIQATNALREQTRRVLLLSEQKDLFLNQLAHDLRTPLTPIIGLVPLLLEGVSDSDSQEIIRIFLSSVQYMQKMADDILLCAELNRTFTLDSFMEYDLSDLIADAIEANQYPAEQMGLTIENTVKPGIAVYISRPYANLVFRNLINNAVKYNAPKGTVKIAASQTDKDVIISIADTGIGMRPDIIDKIWGELYVGDKSRHDPLSKGFGLPIVKKVVELHQGRIEAFSEGHLKGSTFTVYLPKNNV